MVAKAWIFKLLRSPRIDSKEPIPPGCEAWRAGTTAHSYSVPAPIDCLKFQHRSHQGQFLPILFKTQLSLLMATFKTFLVKDKLEMSLIYWAKFQWKQKKWYSEHGKQTNIVFGQKESNKIILLPEMELLNGIFCRDFSA
jgi:hypothetical protein